MLGSNTPPPCCQSGCRRCSAWRIGGGDRMLTPDWKPVLEEA